MTDQQVLPQKVTADTRRGLLRRSTLEGIYFALATAFAAILAIVVFRKSVSTPTALFYLIIFYAILAYLTLPRLNRVLTAIYVPDYFIGRTRTTDGILGDPVNLAYLGTAEQIHTIMQAAGWSRAEPITFGSAVRMVTSAVRRRSYPTAPVSTLLLFGNPHDFAYQQEVDGSPSQRHHVRFWKCPQGWLLPGGRRVDWLAAGTYDRSVGLSLFTLQVTHKIDSNTDIERDYITTTIDKTSPHVQIERLQDFSTGYHHRNGGGDVISTDGTLPIIDVRSITSVDAINDQISNIKQWPQTLTETAKEIGKRPLTIIASCILTLLSIFTSQLVGLQDGSFDLSESNLGTYTPSFAIIVIIMFAIITSITLFFIYFTFLGRRWARVVMLIMPIISLVFESARYLISDIPHSAALLNMTVEVLIVFCLTSDSARRWTQQRTLERRAGNIDQPVLSSPTQSDVR